MKGSYQLAACLMAMAIFVGPAEGQTRTPIFPVIAGNEAGLIGALEQAAAVPEAEIRILRGGLGELEPFVFTRDLFPDNSTGQTVLPPIVSRVRITLAPDDNGLVVFDGGELRFQPRRLAIIGTGGVLEIDGARITGFGSVEDGGAFRLISNGRLLLSDCRVDGNSAVGAGGAIFAESDATVRIDRCIFDTNTAVGNGGVLAVAGAAQVRVNNTGFALNAASEGCAVFQDAEREGDEVSTAIRGSTFLGGCSTIFKSLIDNRGGVLALQGNTILAAADAINAQAPVRLYGNLLLGDVQGKTLCNGSSQIESFGFNLSDQESCALDQETDQPATDPDAEVRNGVLVLKEGSGAIDGASSELTAAISANLGGSGLPCGYKDARNLGRPQDGDRDGTFQCDIGDYEVQGGPDLTAAQSAAFFDPARPGEGVFLEMLDGDQAFVGFFTYRADVSAPAWFVGIGTVEGNSVVVDEMLEVQGGRFGPAFDDNAIERRRVAGMSMVFTTCSAAAGQGKLAFQAAGDVEYPDLLVDATRLSTVIPCTGAAAPNVGLSGSFFDPDRSGEGIFVQWLPDGRVVLIWYTFDPDGNPLWIISGDVSVTGNTVTASMLYPSTATRFGDDFDPDAVVLEDWGTITLDYGECDALTLRYDSMIDGYGAGSLAYSRLTRLRGAACP